MEDHYYVATVHVFERVSADYDVAKRTRTKILSPKDTIGELMGWVNNQTKSMMGNTDVIITEAAREKLSPEEWK